MTKLGEGKQEALSLTNANKGILGVNIAPPKTPSDTATTASSFSTVASPTKLAKLEDMKTGEEEEETEFKVNLHNFPKTQNFRLVLKSINGPMTPGLNAVLVC